MSAAFRTPLARFSLTELVLDDEPAYFGDEGPERDSID